jgi:hypothetical protein
MFSLVAVDQPPSKSISFIWLFIVPRRVVQSHQIIKPSTPDRNSAIRAGMKQAHGVANLI